MTFSGDFSGEAIQKSLDQLTDGGEVVLPAGTYQIRQPIVLRHDNETLRGSGIATKLVLADKANCPVVVIGAALEAPSHVTAHFRLADLIIDGNRKNQQVELWRCAVDGSQLNNNGIDIWNADDVTIENVVCFGCRSGGLVTAKVRRLNLTNYTAYDNQFDGLACYETEQSHFSKLHLYNNVAAGISLDLSFNHNVITDALLTGNDVGIFMRSSRNNVFKGLTIANSRKDGVFMAQATGPVTGGWGLRPGTECTGNNFEGIAVSECGRNAFMVNNASCTNNVIQGAQFMNNVLGGLAEGDGKGLVVALGVADKILSQPNLSPKPDAQVVRTALNR